MDLKNKYSQVYLATITVDMDSDYHFEAIWYGADPKNLALMIIDVMSPWYEERKNQISPKIVKFHEKLEAATAKEDADHSDKKAKSAKKKGKKGSINAKPVTFRELTGILFNSDGMKCEVTLTNNLMDMYMFIGNQAFEIFNKKGEKPEDFNGLQDFIDYLDKAYEVDAPIMNALKNPNESTLTTALYIIDIKYHYSKRNSRISNVTKN